MKRWYVVQTKSKHEDVAKENLKNQLYPVFLPKHFVQKTSRNKRIVEIAPLFPRYLFVQFDISKAKWRSIMGTRGVVGLLGSTDVYASPLPRGFVEELMSDSDRKGILTIKQAETTTCKYLKGDSILVKEGIFSGLSGTCVKIEPDFITLFFALLNGGLEVKLPLNILTPVKG